MKELIKEWREFMKEWRTNPKNVGPSKMMWSQKITKPSFFDFMEWLNKKYE